MCLDLGLSKSTLSDIKSGRKKGVSTSTASKIAAYLDVSVGYLLGEEEKESPATEVTGLTENQIMLLDAVKQMSDDQVKAILTLVQQL